MSALVHIVFESLMIRYGVFALQTKRKTPGVVFAESARKTSFYA